MKGQMRLRGVTEIESSAIVLYSCRFAEAGTNEVYQQANLLTDRGAWHISKWLTQRREGRKGLRGSVRRPHPS